MTPQYFVQLNHLEAEWTNRISSPDWYLTIIPDIQAFTETVAQEPSEVQEAYKSRLYDFFERHLKEGNIALGNRTGEMDAERKPIDTVIIHHTSNPPGLQPDRLSAIELIRLYGPFFANPTSVADRYLRGQPIFSGHVRKGKQVFWPYHWIVRRNGHADRLLYDSEIGWQAGNWEVNCRSIAIALDNDYERSRPSDVELRGIASIIRSHYTQVRPAQVLGHREVNFKTTCPSDLFLGDENHQGGRMTFWRS